MRALLLITGLAFCLSGCRSTPAAKTAASLPATPASSSAAPPPAPQPLYHLKAGGPHLVVGLHSRPESNHVDLAFSREGDRGGIYRVTNREPMAILIWNVRVQTPVTDGGTDGLGWKTVHDDYPSMQSARIEPGAFAELTAPNPYEASWRVCVLYSMERVANERRYYGNYEAISRTVEHTDRQ